MYQRKSRLSSSKQSKLIEHFVAGTTARAAAELIEVQANTAIQFYMRLRKLIASMLPSYEISGEIEADESYFGGVRKGKRGRGAAGKVAGFGLLKRGGKVFTAIIPNAKTETLLPIIEDRVEPGSIVYTDTFRSYDALDVTDFHHSRINHSESLPMKRITSMESKISGTRRSVTCGVSTASNRRTFIGFSRSANGASMEATTENS